MPPLRCPAAAPAGAFSAAFMSGFADPAPVLPPRTGALNRQAFIINPDLFRVSLSGREPRVQVCFPAVIAPITTRVHGCRNGKGNRSPGYGPVILSGGIPAVVNRGIFGERLASRCGRRCRSYDDTAVSPAPATPARTPGGRQPLQRDRGAGETEPDWLANRSALIVHA